MDCQVWAATPIYQLGNAEDIANWALPRPQLVETEAYSRHYLGFEAPNILTESSLDQGPK